jgi:hypothetical protein
VAPQLLCLLGRIFKALLDLDALSSADFFAKNGEIFGWTVKCLVSASCFVIAVLSNDSPSILVEDLLAQNLVGVVQSIQYEPVPEAFISTRSDRRAEAAKAS